MSTFSGVGPTPRTEATADTLADGRIYFFGGRNQVQVSVFSDVFEYSVPQNRFRLICSDHQNRNGIPRYGHRTSVIGKSQILVYGGLTTGATFLNDVRFFDGEVDQEFMYCEKVSM